MIRTLQRLVAIAGVRAHRVALLAVLSALAVGFGVALITTAGYLISRAAEQPPILALTMTIVAVRFFALARPLARYVERLLSHDDALRALGRIRACFYERIEPLAPAQLEGYRRASCSGGWSEMSTRFRASICAGLCRLWSRSRSDRQASGSRPPSSRPPRRLLLLASSSSA
jgi:ABC-type multidrug transport system fused ATPase/permease subunit